MVLNQAVSLLILSFAVAVLPGISRIIRVPASVTEILFGVILGKSLLHLEFTGEWFPFLAELGFLVLMFLAGMEINFNMIKAQTKRQLFSHLLIFGLTLGISFWAAIALGQGIFFALVLSTTSLGLVMPTLRELGLGKTSLGQTILISATLADFLTLLGITIFVLLLQHGVSIRLLYPLPLFAGFAFLLWAARLWAWWHPEKAERILLTQDSQEQGVRMSLALLFLFVGLSELVHLEPVLGAFMGGAIISFVYREKEPLERKISALGFGFLIPFFFIHVGLQLDLGNIFQPDQLLFVLALLVAAFAVKMIPALVIPGWKLALKDRIKAGVLLSSRLSLIIAAASIGVQEGVLTMKLKDSIVFLALLTCFLGPTLFKLMAGKKEIAREKVE